jgi:hypothetical protein
MQPAPSVSVKKDVLYRSLYFPLWTSCPLCLEKEILVFPEQMVTKKKKNKQKPKEESQAEKSLNQPWIAMRTGLKIIAVTSIGMAVLTAWQVIPSQGWLEGILWGLLFGALVWGIFFGNILITRFLRR